MTISSPVRDKNVTRWLFICCGMIFIMSLIGAITRLTGSGLSITDWNPIMGAIPPLTHEAWQRAFDAYKQIPQYKVLNAGMPLTEFQWLYFWEWFHRLWGRLIGFVVIIPLIVFWRQKKIDRALMLRLLLVLLLGAVQGFIGWYMVKSGLSVRTSVSPYRLAFHLGWALLIYAVLLWTALQGAGMKRDIPRQMRPHALMTLTFLVVTIVWGAFVAGLHAGEAYNTWPLMEGEVLPAAAFTLMPHWINAFENLAFVQFIHRWLGPTTMVLVLAWVWRAVKITPSLTTQKWQIALGCMALFQVALGILTLLTGVNIVLAASHQAGAIALLTLLLINLHMLSPLFSRGKD